MTKKHQPSADKLQTIQNDILIGKFGTKNRVELLQRIRKVIDEILSDSE